MSHFTHNIYTLVSNSFISFMSKWDCDTFHSPYLHVHIQLCFEVGVHILLFYQFGDQMRLSLISLISSTLLYEIALSDLRLWLIPPKTTICTCTCLCVDAMLACRLCLIHISEHRKMRAKQQHVCKEMNQYTINTNRKWILSFGIDWTIGVKNRK